MTRANHTLEPEDLMAYLDSELLPDRASEAAAHLSGCKQCQELAAELQQISQAMLVWEVEEPSIDLAAALSHTFEDKPGENRPKRAVRWLRPSHWPKIAWAASGVCALFILAVLSVAILQRTAHFRLAKSSAPNAPSDLVVLDGAVDEYAPSKAGSVGKLKTGLPEPQSTVPVPHGPMIVRTGSIFLIAKNFNAVPSRLNAVVTRQAGYFAELNQNSPAGSARSVTGIIRVPAGQLDSMLNDLKELGRMERETQSGAEVSAEYVDLQARLTNAYNTEQRLTQILRSRTGKLSDVLAVEQEIARVRGDIEEMEAQRKHLENQVNYASVNFSIQEDSRAQLNVLPFSTGMRFRYAFIAGYRLLIDSLIEVSVWLLAWAPTLLVWSALVFLAVRFAWKKVRPRAAQ